MWFFDSATGTFCIRYLREGYGLFLDGECLNWYREADTAAEAVFLGRTGYAPWDGLAAAGRPETLGEWRSHEGTSTPVNAGHDPVIVSLECTCGHSFKESVARVKNSPGLRCPACKSVVKVETERLLELIKEAPRKHGRHARG